MATPVELAPHEREELETRLRAGSMRAEDVRRSRVILMLADGQSYTSIQQALACPATYIARWKKRFEAGRLAGLYSRHQGRRPEKRTPRLEARILEATRKPPADGSTH